MFRGFRQQRRDRRGDYSFRKHLARLKREGRLPRMGVATLAVVLIAAVTFGRCESSITGPAEESADNGSIAGPAMTGILSPPDGGSGGGSGGEKFKERSVERNVVFVGVNPCNGDAVRAVGTRHEWLTIITREPSYFESRSRIKDHFRGYAVNDPYPPPTRYEGHDEHEYNEIITPTKFVSETETHEHLISLGKEPNWKLFFYERRQTDLLNPLYTKVDYRAKASCSHTCTLPEGCVDREMSLASFSETEIPSIP